MASKMNALTNEIAQLKASKARSSGGNVRPSKLRAPRRRNRQPVSGAVAGGSSFSSSFVGRQSNPLSVQRVPRQFPDGMSRSRKFHRVVEDEYIADVNGSVTFATTQFAINPGQAATFPWLARTAAQWEKYHFEYLEFYFKREVSEFATQGQAGKVMLNIDYDASDAPPTSKQQVMDSVPHSDGMPCESFSVKADPREMESSFGEHIVRTGGLPGAADIKTYDVGNLFVSTIANTNTTLVGELHVRYACVFSVPVLDSTTSAPANNSVALFQSSAAETAAADTVPATLLLATSTTNGIGAVNTSGNIVLPAGNYLIDFHANASNSAFTSAAITVDLQKNSTTVYTTATAVPFVYIAVNTANTLRAGGSMYVTSNGTDAFRVRVTVSYSAGTETIAGTIRIVAI